MKVTRVTSNTFLQILIIALLTYFFKNENIVVVLPILVGTTYIAYTFSKDILNALIMGMVLSYSLLILLYKNYRVKNNHR